METLQAVREIGLCQKKYFGLYSHTNLPLFELCWILTGKYYYGSVGPTQLELGLSLAMSIVRAISSKVECPVGGWCGVVCYRIY